MLQWQVVKQTGFTLYSVRKVWDTTEDEFIGGNKYTHEQFDEFKEDIVELLTTYPAIGNNTIFDRLKEKYPDKEFVPSNLYRYMVELLNRLRKESVEKTEKIRRSGGAKI